MGKNKILEKTCAVCFRNFKMDHKDYKKIVLEILRLI